MKAQENSNEHADTAAKWLAECGEGEVSPAKRVALTDWLLESPRNVREFTELTLLSDDVSKLQFTREQLDAWVNEARSAAALPTFLDVRREHNPSGRSQSSALLRGPRLALAAVLLLAVMIGAGYGYWQSGRYATAFGEQRILALADGSVVTLNTASVLRVDFSHDRREVSLLEGEAYFRVAHDAARPFEVSAGDSTVAAIGTQFNVRIAPTATVVSVVDGVVEVREHAAASENEASLAPQTLRVKDGEEARIERDTSQSARNAIYSVKAARTGALRAAAWTRGRVEFEDTSLVDVLAEFQRYRELDVRVAEPLRDLKLTGSFDAQDPQSALAYIDTLPGVVVERTAAHAFLIRRE